MASKNNTNVEPKQIAEAMKLMKEIYRESKAFERKYYQADNEDRVKENIAADYLQKELKKNPSALRKLAIYDLQRYFAQPLESYKSGFLEHTPNQRDIEAYYRGNTDGRITNEEGKEIYYSQKSPSTDFYTRGKDHVVTATAMVDGQEVTISRRIRQAAELDDPVRTIYEISSKLIKTKQVWVNERKDYDAAQKEAAPYIDHSAYKGDALKIGSEESFSEFFKAESGPEGVVAHNPALVAAMGGAVEQVLLGNSFTSDQARRLVTLANGCVRLAPNQQLEDAAKTSALVKEAEAMSAGLGRHPKQSCVQKTIQRLDKSHLIKVEGFGFSHDLEGNDGKLRVQKIAADLSAMALPTTPIKMTTKGAIAPFAMNKQQGCMQETAYVLGSIVKEKQEDAAWEAEKHNKEPTPIKYIPVPEAEETGYYLMELDSTIKKLTTKPPMAKTKDGKGK